MSVLNRVDGSRDVDRFARSERPSTIGEAVSATTRDFGRLLEKELELARVELREEAAAAGKSAALLAVGATMLAMGVLIVLLAAAWGLAEAIPLWAALAIVGVVTVAVGAVVAMAGRRRLARIEPVPQTIETIKEDAQWARQQVS